MNHADMGILDSVRNLAGGAGKGAVPVEMASGEIEQTRAVASLRPGSLTSVGGDLIITSGRIIFSPLNIKDSGALLAWSLAKSGMPAGTSAIVNGAVRLVGDPVRLAARDAQTQRVEVGGEPKLAKPPTLHLVDAAGRRVELGILSSRTAPNISAKNRAERDRIVSVIDHWLRQ